MIVKRTTSEARLHGYDILTNFVILDKLCSLSLYYKIDVKITPHSLTFMLPHVSTYKVFKIVLTHNRCSTHLSNKLYIKGNNLYSYLALYV